MFSNWFELKNIRTKWLLSVVAVGLLSSSAFAGGKLDRVYSMEENFFAGSGIPANSNGSLNPDLMLNPAENATVGFVTNVKKEGAGSVHFSGSSFVYSVEPLRNPSRSANTSLNDYSGIANRGLQAWVRPQAKSGGVGLGAGKIQNVILDSTSFGIMIDAEDNWMMKYSNRDTSSSIKAVADTWTHVQQIRPYGPGNGGWMYINGELGAWQSGGYAGTTSILVLGANAAGQHRTATEAGSVGDSGTADFFRGYIDELEMHVYGKSNSDPVTDHGAFDVATDNEFIASYIGGLSAGIADLNNSGAVDAADATLFIEGWGFKNEVAPGRTIGDIVSLKKGDLNLDGIVNLSDVYQMQQALNGGAGSSVDLASLLSGRTSVPEPSTIILMLCGVLGVFVARRK